MRPTLSDRLSACYSGAAYDVLRERGVFDCVLPSGIMPLVQGTVLSGPIFTMQGRAVDDADAHRTLLGWTDFLSRAPADHVVVCQPNDDSLALMGELSAETLQHRGVRGYLVDGGCRDTAFIRRIGFPVFSRFTTPRDVVAAWMPEAFNVPIVIGGVSISPGDYLLADDDGVVIIPAAAAAEVIAATETVMQTENLVRKAILEGVSPREAYLRHGRF